MPNTYYIQIFIEESGTLLSNGGKSKTGHMWFKIYALDEYKNIFDIFHFKSYKFLRNPILTLTF